MDDYVLLFVINQQALETWSCRFDIIKTSVSKNSVHSHRTEVTGPVGAPNYIQCVFEYPLYQ